jgi:hypothetical protein
MEPHIVWVLIMHLTTQSVEIEFLTLKQCENAMAGIRAVNQYAPVECKAGIQQIKRV